MSIQITVSNFVSKPKRRGDKAEHVPYVKFVGEDKIPGAKRNQRDGTFGYNPRAILAVLDADQKHLREVCEAAIAQADRANGAGQQTQAAAPINVPLPDSEPLEYGIPKADRTGWDSITKSAAEQIAKSTPTMPMIRLVNNQWQNAAGVAGVHSNASEFFPPAAKPVKGELVEPAKPGPLAGAIAAQRQKIAS